MKKRLKDIVLPLSNCPQMPYWGPLKEAVVQLNLAHEKGHSAVLVFDEAYNLVGMLSGKDILKALDGRFAKDYGEGMPILWEGLLESGSEERLAQPIKEFMSEAKVTVDTEDSVLTAAHIMLSNKTCLLPVMEGDRLIGVVRMGDLFHSITNALLKV